MKTLRVARCRATATFDQAFAAARGAGCDEFWWRGHRYHTRRADDPAPQEEPVIDWIKEETSPNVEEVECVGQ